MSKRKPKPKPLLSRADLLWVRLSLFLALGISLYLGWHSLQGGGVPGCGPESDCDKVLSSRWAYAGGLPVSLFAAPVYAALLALSWRREVKWRPVIALSVLILGAAAWFVGIQFFALRAVCKFCMAAHAAGAIAAVIFLRRSPLPASPALPWVGAGAAAVLVLIAAQLLYTAPKPLVVTFEDPAEPAAPSPKAAPVFAVFGGQFKLDLQSVPVHGNPAAPSKVVKLFDYTCHHCRDLYHHFQPILARFSNELAVISLPMPLDASCNYLMKRTPPAHQNACDYARLGLAVFMADPAKTHEYEEWFFRPPRPPALTATRARAEELVGKEALAKALANPELDAQLKRNIDLYATNSRAARNGRMPQLIFKQGTTIGAIRSPEQLLMALKKSLPRLGQTNSAAAPK